MPDEIAAAGRAVVDLLGACAAAPDDLETGRAADDALMKLDRLLAASGVETGEGTSRQLSTASSSPSPKGTNQ